MDWKTIKDSDEEWEREIKYVGGSPRSIIGDKDGNIFAIKDNSVIFINYGVADALIKSEINGRRIDRMCVAMKYIYQYYERFRIKIGSMFLILRDANGGYITSNGVLYDIFYLGKRMPSVQD